MSSKVKRTLFLLLFMAMTCGLAACVSGAGDASGGNPAAFEAARSSTNSYFPTSDGVNAANQPVHLRWQYVLSGSTQTTMPDELGDSYWLQKYETVYDPTTNEITENIRYGIAEYSSTTITELNYHIFTFSDGRLFIKESGETESLHELIEDEDYYDFTRRSKQVYDHPYLEQFLGRPDLGTLPVGFATTVQANATETFSGSDETQSPNGAQITQNWNITNIYPTMTLQGKTYSDVIEATKKDHPEGPISTFWVAKGIGVIKVSRPAYNLNGVIITLELKETNLSQ